jgi:hypothetical protein
LKDGIMRITFGFLVAIAIGCLVIKSASADIVFDVDNSDTLTGSFILDVDDFTDIRASVASFNHFRIPSDTERGRIEIQSHITNVVPLFITGENESRDQFYGIEQYDSLTELNDRSGTYVSPFDGRMVQYQYTNLSFTTGAEFRGNFNFQAIPEPSSMGILGAAMVIGIIGRRRRSRTRVH